MSILPTPKEKIRKLKAEYDKDSNDKDSNKANSIINEITTIGSVARWSKILDYMIV